MPLRTLRHPAFLVGLVLTVLMIQALSYLVHAVLLQGLYEAQAPGLFRSEADMMERIWGYWLGTLVAVLVLGVLLERGGARPTASAGARLGLLLGLYHGLAGAVEQWVTFELSGTMALSWMVAAVLTSTVAGAFFAKIAGRAYGGEAPR